MPDFRAKCTKSRFRLGLRPRSRWGSLQRSPDPLAGFEGPTSKGRGGKGRGKEERRRRGRGREGRRGEGKGRREERERGGRLLFQTFLGPGW